MTEAQAREALVRYGRELWERRLVTGSSGNLSVRLPDASLLVTPASRSLRNLEPDELVHTTESGEPLGRGTPTSELPLHVACYRVRTDISCVVHTHPTFCVAWSKTGRVFDQDTVGARETLGPATWTPYRPPGSQDLADIVSEAARSYDTIVMERHGLSALGQTLERAFLLSDLAEEAAKIAFFTKILSSQ